MSGISRLYYLVRADVLERLRRRSFLIVLGVVVYAAYLFLPANHTKLATLHIGTYRGVYNSAWVGSLVAVMSGVYIAMLGFYLVKNALERDRRTRVGEILAATPLSRVGYVYVKMLSNAVVLSVMVGVIVIAAAGMQLVRGESYQLMPLDLVLPFAFFTFPTLLLVAAIAVLFESVRFLRGGLGNVVYFFLWTISLATIATALDSGRTRNDPMGMGILIPTIKGAVYAEFPQINPDSTGVAMGFHIRGDGRAWDMTTFAWHGMDWSGSIAAQRAVWIALALFVTLLAALFFDRFDPAVGTVSRRARDAVPAQVNGMAVAVNGGSVVVPAKWGSASKLSPLVARAQRSRFGTLVIAELKIALQGQSRWWYLVALGLLIAGVAAPAEVGRRWLLPVSWIWPALIWSAMGVREARFATDQILFSSPRPVARQLPAIWTAGFLVAVVCGAGVALRLLLGGEFAALGAWLAAATFIPSLALACGVWTGGSKLFEVLYLILWYVGPMSAFPALDFMGSTTEAVKMGVPVVIALVSLLLMMTAVLGRIRQLRTD